MSEEIVITDIVDKAIIEALNEADAGVLPTKAIKRLVRERINVNEGLIAKRIENRSKDARRYLLRCGRGLYKLDPSITVTFLGEALPPKEKPIKSAEIQGEIDESLEKRKAHTHDLMEAIRNWIDHIPEPTYRYSQDQETSYSSQILVCEELPLFSDLSNHFSPLGINVLANWEDYKKEMLALDAMKAKVFEYTKHKVLACFEGLDLHFVPEIDGGQDFNNEDNGICISVPFDLYNYCFSYHQFYRSVGKTDPYIDIFYPFPDYEKNQCAEMEDSVFWHGLIRVRKTDRDALLRGRKRLLEVLRNPPDNCFMFDVNAVISKVEKANESKESLISELIRIQSYSSLPGECKHLQ